MGGEEFLLILTHSSKEGVVTVTERIRAEFEATKFNFDAQRQAVKSSFTASFGVAMFEGTRAPDFSGLVARADAALYSAKQRGRNRIEMASTEVP
jgi:diguanylate cyclase (GGDEF)-like protein